MDPFALCSDCFITTEHLVETMAEKIRELNPLRPGCKLLVLDLDYSMH
jgi:hypothetical protein